MSQDATKSNMYIFAFVFMFKLKNNKTEHKSVFFFWLFSLCIGYRLMVDWLFLFNMNVSHPWQFNSVFLYHFSTETRHEPRFWCDIFSLSCSCTCTIEICQRVHIQQLTSRGCLKIPSSQPGHFTRELSNSLNNQAWLSKPSFWL